MLNYGWKVRKVRVQPLPAEGLSKKLADPGVPDLFNPKPIRAAAHFRCAGCDGKNASENQHDDPQPGNDLEKGESTASFAVR